MKWLFTGIAVLLALVIVAAAVLYFSLDTLTRRGIVNGTTYATGTTTTLDSAGLSLTGGELTLDTLVIGNPDGFNSPHFMRLDEGEVAVTISSLLGDQVEVPRLHLTGVDVNLERREGQSNYDVILENLEKLQGPPEEQPRDGKKYIIREIVISDVRVMAALLSLDGGEPREMSIRLRNDIRLTDVGSETEGGVLLEQVSGIIVNAVLEAALEEAGDRLPGVIADGLRSELDDLGEIGGVDVGTVLEGLGGILGNTDNDEGQTSEEDATRDAEDAVRQGVEEGLGGLLNRNRQRENDDADGDGRE
ncbi:MAG: AsmA family protein [Phycisphaeraceae bacterium]